MLSRGPLVRKIWDNEKKAKENFPLRRYERSGQRIASGGIVKNYLYPVQWTIPFQSSFCDRHDLERDLICWPKVKVGSKKVSVAAFKRKVADGTLYEPIYMEFDPDQTVQCIAIEPDFDPEVDEHELECDLEERLQARVLADDGKWVTVDVKPVLVRAEVDESGEMGLAIGYALCDVIRVGQEGFINLLSANFGRYRCIVTVDGEEKYEPFYYLWGE
jgi:hypothetical protein